MKQNRIISRKRLNVVTLNHKKHDVAHVCNECIKSESDQIQNVEAMVSRCDIVKSNECDHHAKLQRFYLHCVWETANVHVFGRTAWLPGPTMNTDITDYHSTDLH